jgi:hypothetical protein
MEYTYEKITTEMGSEVIKRTDENGSIAWIPLDPANSDYQEYLNPSETKTE